MLVVVEVTEETKVLMVIVPVLVVAVVLVDLQMALVNLDAILLAAVAAVIV